MDTGKSLRDIAEERQTLNEFLTEMDGELTPEIEALFDDHEGDLASKVERIGFVIQQNSDLIAATGATIDRLIARNARRTKQNEWLKNSYLARLLAEMGMEPGDKVVGGTTTVRLQLNNPRLEGEVLPEKVSSEYRRIVPEEVVVDRAALLRDAKLDASVLPEGVRVVQDISVRLSV